MTDGIGIDELVVERVVPAPPGDVFHAWTDPDSLRAWWRPPGGVCAGAQIDLRSGGRYSIVNEFGDGSTITIQGEFLEIIPNALLTYTWGVDPTVEPSEYVTVTFASHDDGTLVTVRHVRIPTLEMFEGHRIGWNSCIDGLVDSLH